MLSSFAATDVQEPLSRAVRDAMHIAPEHTSLGYRSEHHLTVHLDAAAGVHVSDKIHKILVEDFAPLGFERHPVPAGEGWLWHLDLTREGEP